MESNNKTWREQIKSIGGSRVANMMCVKYPTVYRYIKDGSKILPREMSKPLCDAMEKYLTAREYQQFKKSLQSEMTRFL